MSASASPSRAAFAAHLRLSRRHGHWWACIWAPTNPPTPAEIDAAWSAWCAAPNTDAFRSATNARLLSDLIRQNGADEGQQRYDEDWGGVVFRGVCAHTTQSGTLTWVVSSDGTATLTGYRRGAVLYDEAGERAPVGGPDSPAWWTAVVRPSGATTITTHPGAPEPGGDRWEDDHSTEAPRLGAYAWCVLACAVAGAGGTVPALPPMPPLADRPRRLPAGGSRAMHRIA